ncbi:tyrosine-type recombinase/integrase [Lentzea kentuckyensis]|uniref:tyrosine-type recombinase/integrase n=1 Tax=Lentzea kentuckyensis TaxID=360086 RepID=UPI000A375F0F|nr:tyrosine-type recombinase/integrase [Lentzea kentuckyensis]
MKPTFNVRFWAIQHKKTRRRPYGVRWITEGQEHSEWFMLKAQADNRRSNLMQAARKGEPFDIATGLPESEYRERNAKSLLALVQAYIDHHWQNSAPNTRRRHVDTMAVAVAAYVLPDKSAPDERVLRRVLTCCLLPTNRRDRELPPEEDKAARWIEQASRPARDLADKIEAEKLLQALSRNLGGRTAASWTTRTRRGVLHHVLNFGVDAGALDVNPIPRTKVAIERGNSEVDPRVVLNPRQARQVLAALTYAGTITGQYDYLHAFFATMYYGALRPAEVNRLREQDCKLSESGWGELLLEKSASRANARYTDSGETWEVRNLKRRAQGSIRRVPIPPALVQLLRWHIERFGVTEDGRLFRGTISGGPINATVYTDAWDRARKLGLSPEQYDSPLGEDPYDLRHAAVSTWLAAGVPAAEVAERAGHTVEVLLKVYARVLDGQLGTSNNKIDGTLGEPVTQTKPDWDQLEAWLNLSREERRMLRDLAHRAPERFKHLIPDWDEGDDGIAQLIAGR